jgi:hypothetical protein
LIRGTHLRTATIGRAATIGILFPLFLVAAALVGVAAHRASGHAAAAPDGVRDVVQATAALRPTVAPAAQPDARARRSEGLPGIVGAVGLVLVGEAARFVGWMLRGRRAGARGGVRRSVLGRAPPALA